MEDIKSVVSWWFQRMMEAAATALYTLFLLDMITIYNYIVYS
nr:hypothetical protein [uncultured Anaerocolumna sp.]